MMKIKSTKLMSAIKWSIYSLTLIIIYALQTTPRLFQIFGIKPILILPLIVCISMYEGIMPSAIFSMIAGLLWDISSDKLFGFNAVILLSCSVLITLICIFYLHTKLLNSMAFCLVTALLQGLLDFLFYYAIWKYDNVSIILVKDILPTILYTVILTPLFYWGVKYINSKFSLTTRV